jgi:hypothetical protein
MAFIYFYFPRVLRGTTSFQAIGVLLGLVLRMGMSSWVEETAFVEVVRAVAQFRRSTFC